MLIRSGGKRRMRGGERSLRELKEESVLLKRGIVARGKEKPRLALREREST